jgi:hypothetical protein
LVRRFARLRQTYLDGYRFINPEIFPSFYALEFASLSHPAPTANGIASATSSTFTPTMSTTTLMGMLIMVSIVLVADRIDVIRKL